MVRGAGHRAVLVESSRVAGGNASVDPGASPAASPAPLHSARPPRHGRSYWRTYMTILRAHECRGSDACCDEGAGEPGRNGAGGFVLMATQKDSAGLSPRRPAQAPLHQNCRRCRAVTWRRRGRMRSYAQAHAGPHSRIWEEAGRTEGVRRSSYGRRECRHGQMGYT